MNLIVLTSVDSTNNYLRQLCEKGEAEEGTAVLALEQSAGKGQRGRTWESRAGQGLYLSILLMPENCPVEKQFQINKAIAVGVATYVESRCEDKVQIKWPNDVLVSGKKISGILIENNIRGHKLSSVIAGIGVNLNQDEFTDEFNTPATSLFHLNHQKFVPETEAKALFREVWNAYCQLNAGEEQWIEAQYAHRLYMRGEMAVFMKGEGLFSGVLTGVDDAGLAMIEENGKIIRASHPGIRFYVRGT